MGIYLNGIHISRKLSTEKGNYAQLINRRNSFPYRKNEALHKIYHKDGNTLHSKQQNLQDNLYLRIFFQQQWSSLQYY